MHACKPWKILATTSMIKLKEFLLKLEKERERLCRGGERKKIDWKSIVNYSSLFITFHIKSVVARSFRYSTSMYCMCAFIKAG